MTKLVLAPVSRVPGQLKVELEIENKQVVRSKVAGTAVRGLEATFKGHHPGDAQLLSQRICGICPVAHGIAAAQALEAAFGAVIPSNAGIMRNLLLGTNFLLTHIYHFYQIALPDYVRDLPAPFAPEPALAPALPVQINAALGKHFLLSLEVSRTIQEMLAVFGGRMPHPSAVVPGGVTENPDAQKITTFRSRLKAVKDFIRNIYLPDVYTLARYCPQVFAYGTGTGNLLSLGAYPRGAGSKGQPDEFFKPGCYTNGRSGEVDPSKIKEELRYAWYEAEAFRREKPEAYSWVKAPRYQGAAYELGALARMIIHGHPEVKALGGKAFSAMGRHIARAEESLLLAGVLEEWLTQLEPGKPVAVNLNFTSEAQGTGLTEAPQGALLHRLEVHKGVIRNYQVIAPATWNGSPRDDGGSPGPLEQALVGTPVPDSRNLLEVYRVIRSFDLCLACATH